jgi:HK97 family phage prohead protease
MPYEVIDNAPDCNGFAVVKVGETVVVAGGCHIDSVDAYAHMGALNDATKTERAVGDSFEPPAGVRAEAQRALGWIADGHAGSGFTDVGRRRASMLAAGEPVSLDVVKRMSSYLARHAVDKEGAGWSPDDVGYPSPGRVAWAAWGGDPAVSWTRKVLDEIANGRSNKMTEETRDGGIEGMYPLTPHQLVQMEAESEIVDVFGQYDQGSGADGAHYVSASPFAADGLVCSSCAYYEGPRACELVAGDIDPNGICKKWVIPESLVDPAAVANGEAVDTQLLMDGVMDPAASDAIPMRYVKVDTETRKVNGRDVEVRSFNVGELEIRAVDGEGMRFSGYAAVFNSDSEPLPFIERIAPGAFKRSLGSNKEIRMFANHNTDQVLATTRNNSLVLTEDARGLKVDAQLPDTTVGRDLATLIADGTVHSMSFGFSVPRGGDTWSDNGASRVLREVVLHEVSVVTGFPAYPETTGATVRNADDTISANESSSVPVALVRRKFELHSKKLV